MGFAGASAANFHTHASAPELPGSSTPPLTSRPPAVTSTIDSRWPTSSRNRTLPGGIDPGSCTSTA
jgi:hypothetical protein